jgi:SAM-dependent methyltransferase
MSSRGADRWFFDVWSVGYDWPIAQRLAYRPVHDAVLHALGRGTRGRRVLDVGCGTGELLRRVTAAFPGTKVVGCDFSAGMLRRAAAKGGTAQWVRGDACRLPFRSAAFDVVLSTEAFHWFPDQDHALREFRRVLVPGGRLLVALVTPPWALLGTVAHAGSRLIGQPFYWPTQAEIRRQIERARFEVEAQHRVFRFPGLLLQPVLTSARRSSTR